MFQCTSGTSSCLKALSLFAMRKLQAWKMRHLLQETMQNHREEPFTMKWDDERFMLKGTLTMHRPYCYADHTVVLTDCKVVGSSCSRALWKGGQFTVLYNLVKWTDYKTQQTFTSSCQVVRRNAHACDAPREMTICPAFEAHIKADLFLRRRN